MSERQRIINLAEKMMEHISFANAYIDVYQTINNARVRYNEKVNYAPGFFSVTIMALTNSIFMETGKLVDPHREAFSFYKLINLCKDNQDVFLIKVITILI